MRTAILILLAGSVLPGCRGPRHGDEKSVDPSAMPTAAKTDVPATQPAVPANPPAVKPPAANPHAGQPATEGAPAGGSPGMNFTPNYDEGDDGMRIDDVRPDGAAAKAGILAGDVLIKFGGVPIGDVHDYMAALGTVRVGEQVEIVVKRGTETKTLKGVVGVSAR